MKPTQKAVDEAIRKLEDQHPRQIARRRIAEYRLTQSMIDGDPKENQEQRLEFQISHSVVGYRGSLIAKIRQFLG